MSSLSFNRKGQFQNYIAVVIFLLAFGFLSMFAYLLMSNFVDGFISTGLYTGVLAETGNRFLAGIALFDYIIVFLAVLLIIAVGLTTFKLAAAPAFFVITMVMGCFLGYVSYFFNYVFAQLISDVAFVGVQLAFPRTIMLCTNLHWVALVTMVVGSITLYAKKERGQFLG